MAREQTCSVSGIERVVVEEVARDARVQGDKDIAELRVTFHQAELNASPQFIQEDRTLYLRGAPVTRLMLPAALDVTLGKTAGDLRVLDVTGRLQLDAVQGDLRLKGLAGPVEVDRVFGELRGDGVADLRITGACYGDLRFQDGGDLTCEAVSGDLRLYKMRSAQLGQVRGELWAEDIEGSLQADRVHGDVRLSSVAGEVRLRAVVGDLRLRGLEGGLQVDAANGDVHLEGPFSASVVYTLVAEGDVTVQLPADADLRLSLTAGGRIRSAFQLTPANDGSRSFTATLGRGAGRMFLNSAGDMRLRQTGVPAGEDDPSLRWQDLGDRIRQQVAASLATAGINVELAGQEWKGWGRQRTSFGSRSHRHDEAPSAGRPQGTRPSGAEKAQSRAASRPSPEEQMVILRMVEAGTISAAEAEELLKALGMP